MSEYQIDIGHRGKQRMTMEVSTDPSKGGIMIHVSPDRAQTVVDSLISQGIKPSTEVLFPALVNAGVDRNSLFDLIRRDSTPEAVCEVGFREYEATGQERCLLLTVSLLEDFGEEAWPVLKELAASKHPECELFVGLIANCDGVSSTQRADALCDLATHAEPVVRLTILDDLSDLSVDDSRSVLESLKDDSDDDVREEARQRLFDMW